MKNVVYEVPAYALVNIVKYKIKEALPEQFVYLKSLEYCHGQMMHVLQNENDYYGCVSSDDTVAFELFTLDTPCWCLGYKRKSINELQFILDNFKSTDVGSGYKPPSKFEDSPTGLMLKKNLPSAVRYSGAVFKNIKTNEEIKITSSFKDVFMKRLKMKNYKMEVLLYGAKLVNDWYIDRIENDVGPIANMKKNSVNGYFVKNNVKLDVLLPVQSISSVTGLNKNQVKNLYTGEKDCINGWKFVKIN